MARTYRTDYSRKPRAARDGKVRNWTTRGRRTRGEVAAQRQVRQQARAEIAAQLEDMRPLLTPELVSEAWAEKARMESEAEMAAWLEEERAFFEANPDYDPAYEKWLERQEEKAWYTEAIAKAWALAYRAGLPLPERMEYPWEDHLSRLAAA